MKKVIQIVIFLICSLPVFSLGYNFNLSFDAGLSECISNDENFASNINFWNNEFNDSSSISGNMFLPYLSTGANISTNIIFTQNMSVEAGLSFKKMNINYKITNNELGNNSAHWGYSIINIPVLFTYTIPLKKTTEILNSINLSAGLNLSYLLPLQYYKDDNTEKQGDYLNPFINANASIKATYAHKIGPGNLFVGLKGDLNFIPQKYNIKNTNDVRSFNIGNILTVAPVIGYSFIIKEDIEISKVTEKNKRIKDIDVQ